jgi:hypothetical protein
VEDAQVRFGAFVFRSDHGQRELAQTVERIAAARVADEDHRRVIGGEFEALDDAGLAILSRARFLNSLASEIPGDPKKITIDFLQADGVANEARNRGRSAEATGLAASE